MQQVLKATESYKIIRKTKSRLKNKVKSDQNVRFISDSMFLILSKTNEYGLITNNLATKCGQPRDMHLKLMSLYLEFQGFTMVEGKCSTKGLRCIE